MGGSGSVVRISADSVNINGFMIRNSGSTWPDAGIHVYYSDYTTISGNNVTSNNKSGILLFTSSENAVVENTDTGFQHNR